MGKISAFPRVDKATAMSMVFFFLQLDFFMRTHCFVCALGVVGDWKNHFSSKQLAHFSSVIYKELEGESFTLPWSLDGAADVTKADEKVEML